MTAKRLFAFLASALGSLAIIACSSATQSSSSNRCRLTPEDSGFVASGVYTACLVDRRAVAIRAEFRLDPTSLTNQRTVLAVSASTAGRPASSPVGEGKKSCRNGDARGGSAFRITTTSDATLEPAAQL